MSDFGIYAGDTDKTIYVVLRDSSTGLAKTGLAYNSAGAVCSYVLPGAARAAITLATQTVTGAHSDGGFVEVDATNSKGLYRLDLTDAAIASGDFSLISIEFDGVIEETVLVPLHVRDVNAIQVSGSATAADNLETAALAYSATRGLAGTALPAAAADAAGGLPVSDAGGLDMDAILADTDAIEQRATEVRLGELDAANLPLDIDTIDGNVDALLTRITSTLFSGITSLAEWLGLMAGDQTGDSTARTEVRATGAGSGTYDETTDSLEAIAGAGGGGAPTVIQIRQEMDSNSTQLAAIVADTNELQTDDVPGLIAALNDPTAAAIRTEIDSNSTQLAAIVADTNELQTDWANGGRLDLLIDAIKVVTDAIPNSGAMTSIATASALATTDAVCDAIKVITDALGATAAANLALSCGSSGIVTGAAEAGTLSTTVMTTDLTEATDDHYIGRVIIWTSGALAGQATDITDYAGTAGTLTYTAVTEAPGAGDAFIVV